MPKNDPNMVFLLLWFVWRGDGSVTRGWRWLARGAWQMGKVSSGGRQAGARTAKNG
jgi:hypothetical protein